MPISQYELLLATMPSPTIPDDQVDDDQVDDDQADDDQADDTPDNDFANCVSQLKKRDTEFANENTGIETHELKFANKNTGIKFRDNNFANENTGMKIRDTESTNEDSRKLDRVENIREQAQSQTKITASFLTKDANRKPEPHEKCGWLHFTHAQWDKASKEDKLIILETIIEDAADPNFEYSLRKQTEDKVYEYITKTLQPHTSIVPDTLLHFLFNQYVQRNRHTYVNYSINTTTDPFTLTDKNGRKHNVELSFGVFTVYRDRQYKKPYTPKYVQHELPHQKSNNPLINQDQNNKNQNPDLDTQLDRIETLLASTRTQREHDQADQHIAEYVLHHQIKTQYLSSSTHRAIMRSFAKLNGLYHQPKNTDPTKKESGSAFTLYTDITKTKTKRFKLEYGIVTEIETPKKETQIIRETQIEENKRTIFKKLIGR